MSRRQVWVSRGKALWTWLNNPYFNGAYWEPKPWKSILFALALIAICLVVTPLLFELLVNTSFDFEWFDKAEEFVSQGARYV